MKKFKIMFLLLVVMSLQAKAQQRNEHTKQTKHTENSNKHHDGRDLELQESLDIL